MVMTAARGFYVVMQYPINAEGRWTIDRPSPNKKGWSSDLRLVRKGSTAAEQAKDAQEHNGPNKGNEKAPDIESGCACNAECIKNETTDQSADNADDDVHD